MRKIIMNFIPFLAIVLGCIYLLKGQVVEGASWIIISSLWRIENYLDGRDV